MTSIMLILCCRPSIRGSACRPLPSICSPRVSEPDCEVSSLLSRSIPVPVLVPPHKRFCNVSVNREARGCLHRKCWRKRRLAFSSIDHAFAWASHRWAVAGTRKHVYKSFRVLQQAKANANVRPTALQSDESARKSCEHARRPFASSGSAHIQRDEETPRGAECGR